MMVGLTYCPVNDSLASITEGNITTCFIDTVINPLLVLVAAAAGLHQWRLYRRFSTPVETSNIRPSKLFIFQILFQVMLPMVSLADFLLSGDQYCQVLHLITTMVTSVPPQCTATRSQSQELVSSAS